MSADVELLVLLDRLRPPWHARGRCRGADTNTFFPTRGESVESARRVCGGCEVRGECLDYALEHGISHGVWGGTSEAERRRIRRQQRVPGATELAVRRLAQQGLAAAEIAEQLSVTPRTVHRYLSRGAA